MASGGPFQSLYRARLARARRRRFAENLASLLAGLGFAVVAVVATRWAWGESALFGWAAGGWAIAAAVSVLVAFVLSRPGGRARRLVAEASREHGLLAIQNGELQAALAHMRRSAANAAEDWEHSPRVLADLAALEAFIEEGP